MIEEAFVEVELLMKRLWYTIIYRESQRSTRGRGNRSYVLNYADARQFKVLGNNLEDIFEIYKVH
jgi:hypothetical protein